MFIKTIRLAVLLIVCKWWICVNLVLLTTCESQFKLLFGCCSAVVQLPESSLQTVPTVACGTVITVILIVILIVVFFKIRFDIHFSIFVHPTAVLSQEHAHRSPSTVAPVKGLKICLNLNPFTTRSFRPVFCLRLSTCKYQVGTTNPTAKIWNS